MAGRISLDVDNGVYNPDYGINFYKNGDPRKRIRSVDLGSVLSITTSKSLNDIAGTWSITIKDGSAISRPFVKGKKHGHFAREALDQMDVVTIRLRGHDGNIHPVLHGVTDDVVSSGDAGVDSANDSTVINGRCCAKYLQETSLFLPVWDPSALLPTALIFGLGAAANVLFPNGKNMPKTPRGIFGALCDAFTYGKRNMVGESGIPNSRYWLNRKKRFQKLDYLVPFLQFNEDSMATVFKSLEILGFTEAWVDETGNTVYRHPQWDAPADYSISTGSLIDWNFTKSDPEATYVEVIPGGSLLLDTGLQQALMAGRAPVPESYLTSANGSNDLGQYVSKEYIIDTDAKGKVTAKGRRNHWYQQQRQYGLRPQQITSPLIARQDQAQAQAEGLLKFYSRFQKSASITFPGQSVVRLGRNILIHGELDGVRLNRTYYIEGVSHNYTEGEGYTTTLQLTHGRDPGDPKWGAIALPQTTITDVVAQGGVIGTSSDGGGNDVKLGSGGGGLVIQAGANRPGVGLTRLFQDFAEAVASNYGGTMTLTTGTNHDQYVAGSHNVSDHWGGNAGDFYIGGDVRYGQGDVSKGNGYAVAALITCGISEAKARKWVEGMYDRPPYNINVNFEGKVLRVQVIWKSTTGGNHFNHVHIGIRVDG